MVSKDLIKFVEKFKKRFKIKWLTKKLKLEPDYYADSSTDIVVGKTR